MRHTAGCSGRCPPGDQVSYSSVRFVPCPPSWCRFFPHLPRSRCSAGWSYFVPLAWGAGGSAPGCCCSGVVLEYCRKLLGAPEWLPYGAAACGAGALS
jgi:hypothetical protein